MLHINHPAIRRDCRNSLFSYAVQFVWIVLLNCECFLLCILVFLFHLHAVCAVHSFCRCFSEANLKALLNATLLVIEH